MKWCTVHVFLLALSWANCQILSGPTFFTKQANTNGKIVPRFGRSRTSPDDFENFFLKASKSVPRIGRRGYLQPIENTYDSNVPTYYKDQELPAIFKKAGNHFKEVPWTELAEMVEYYPEIMLNSPPMWPEGAFKDNLQFEDYGKRKAQERTNNLPEELPNYKNMPVPQI